MFQSIVFILLLAITAWYAKKGYSKVIRNIRLGKAEVINDRKNERWNNVLLVALGQRKMFKNMIPAVLHFFIYAAFLLTQIELLETIIDGIFGTHRFLAPYFGFLYTLAINFIEILSVLAFVATIAFLMRRNVLKVARFQKPELRGFPFKDANLILFGEITLICGIFCMNGAEAVLNNLHPGDAHAGPFAISSWVGPALFGGFSETALHVIAKFGWWLHAVTVFAFIVYLPYSKHLHIFLAFVNTWFAKLTPKGKMENIPEIQKEVRIMMGMDQAEAGAPGEMPDFGANDVFSLSWKNIMDAYTCTECGRCTASCPANLTGKKLSPRKVMMDVRDRAEEIGNALDAGAALPFTDQKTLFDRITPEELHACTTCNACVEACPVLINPLDIILKMRRYEILMQSAGPTEWLPMFNAIENSGACWQMPEDREAWRRE